MNDSYESHRVEVHRVQLLDRVRTLLFLGKLRGNP
jgi:hypothetical protein